MSSRPPVVVSRRSSRLGAFALIAGAAIALSIADAAAARQSGPASPPFPAFADQSLVMPVMGGPPERAGLATKNANIAPIWDHDLAAWSAPIAMAGAQLSFAFGQCFGGGMLDNLKNLGAGDISATSASRWDEFAWYPRPLAQGGINKDWADVYLDKLASAAGPGPLYRDLADHAYKNDPWGTFAGAPRGNEAARETAQWAERGFLPGFLAPDDQARNNRYAVLYSGEPNAVDRAQLNRAFQILTNPAGLNYRRDRIYVVAGNGALEPLPAGAGDIYDPVNGVPMANRLDATPADLQNLLTVTLAGLGAADQLLFFANDHGVLQTSRMAPGCYIRIPKQGDPSYPSPSYPHTLPYSPSMPPPQYLGSVDVMFDIINSTPDNPYGDQWIIRDGYQQFYVPTPGATALGTLGLLMLGVRRRNRPGA